MDIYSITKIVWEDEGNLAAYNSQGDLVTKLTPQGLQDLQKIHVGFTLVDERVKTPAPTFPKGPVNIGVRVVSTGAIARSDCPERIDGVSLNGGDKVLLVGQPNPNHNGVHVIKEIAKWGARKLRLTRIPTEVGGTVVVCMEGAIYEQCAWILHGEEWEANT